MIEYVVSSCVNPIIKSFLSILEVNGIYREDFCINFTNDFKVVENEILSEVRIVKRNETSVKTIRLVIVDTKARLFVDYKHNADSSFVLSDDFDFMDTEWSSRRLEEALAWFKE